MGSTRLLIFLGAVFAAPWQKKEHPLPKKLEMRAAVLFFFFLALHFLDATIAETEYYGTNWNDAAAEAVEAVNEVLRIFGRKRRKTIVAFRAYTK
jgi:hypothetical protein